MFDSNIGKVTQLTLHAGLGALTSGLTGNDILSGAVSGVVGELSGEIYGNLGFDRKTGSELAGMTSAITSLIVGKSQGLNDDEIVSNIFNGQRLGKNASENNAYFGKRKLEGKPWLGKLSSNPGSKMDLKNIEISHEHIFFEDEEGGNIGFFNDGTVRSDNDKLLDTYKYIDDEYYDDAILREAIDTVVPKPYKLFDQSRTTGIGTDDQYNCQDWAEEVRKEYYKILNNNQK